MEDELKEFIHLGADLALTKPMKPDLLTNMLSFLVSADCISMNPSKVIHLEEGKFSWANKNAPVRQMSFENLSAAAFGKL